jgi:two-component system OmpR family sensor kinase
MKDLTESLLTLARIEAGTIERRRDTVELRAIADDVVTDMQPLARDRDVSIQIDGHATVAGDGVQLRMLLSNLVSNAVRYNRRGGSVAIRLRRDDRRVELEVADTGPGLDAEQRARVFGRFWRADVSRSARDGGSGLGLAISKAVVIAHGGTIACRAVEPHGAAFAVVLPVGAAVRDDAGPGRSPDRDGFPSEMTSIGEGSPR